MTCIVNLNFKSGTGSNFLQMGLVGSDGGPNWAKAHLLGSSYGFYETSNQT